MLFHFMCVYVYAHMHMCVHVCMLMYACANVFVYVCIVSISSYFWPVLVDSPRDETGTIPGNWVYLMAMHCGISTCSIT